MADPYLFGENQARDEFYRQMDVPNRLLTPEQIPERFLKITIFHSFRGSGVAQFFGGTPEEDAEFTAVASQIAAAWPELSVDRSGRPPRGPRPGPWPGGWAGAC